MMSWRFVAQGESGLFCRSFEVIFWKVTLCLISKVIQQFDLTFEEDSVFLRWSPLQKHIYLVVYVDDIVIIGDNQERH